jgi:PAS domain S-box-containing protein
VDRSEAFKQVEALLEAEGRADLLVELRRALHALESYETHGKTISEVTRALLESEKTYRLVFSHELDPMSLFDPATGSFLDVNDSWVKLYGYSRDEALAMKVTDVSAEPSRTQSAILQLPLGETLRVAVRWHRAKDGTVFPSPLRSATS